MRATLEATPLEEQTRDALFQFFVHSSAYLTAKEAAAPEHEELAGRWLAQRVLDDAIVAIAAGDDHQALALAPQFASRPPLFIGLLARMVQSGRPGLIRFVMDALESEPSLAAHCFAGRTLLHIASAAGCLKVVASLLRFGSNPNIQDRGGHTPLYSVANECASATGAEMVGLLLRAGANVNACGGVTRSTALHMAARRGHIEIARALIDGGAAVDAKDNKGDTPLQRAINCRRHAVAELLADRGATPAKPTVSR